MVNRQIVIAVVVIGFSGLLRIWTGQAAQGSSVTRVLLGAYLLMLVLSIMDLFGGIFSTLAGAIAMLAALVVVITEIPWGIVFQSVSGPTSQAGTPRPGENANQGGQIQNNQPRR